MRKKLGFLLLGATLSMSACGTSPSIEDDAAVQADMAPQDGAIEDSATLLDGALVDAELPADMSRDFGADVGPSGCTSDEMCADPIRERCNTTTRACEGRPQWAITTIQYEDGEARDLRNIYFDSATIFESGEARLGFQQGDGATVWDLTLPAGTMSGNHVIEPRNLRRIRLGVNESSALVPSMYRGYWYAIEGTLEMEVCVLSPSGVVQGTLDAVLEYDGDRDSRATIRSVFFARFSE